MGFNNQQIHLSEHFCDSAGTWIMEVLLYSNQLIVQVAYIVGKIAHVHVDTKYLGQLSVLLRFKVELCNIVILPDIL